MKLQQSLKLVCSITNYREYKATGRSSSSKINLQSIDAKTYVLIKADSNTLFNNENTIEVLNCYEM